ncbi:MAG: hypothetical protein V1770_03440 [bacterium]
MRLSIGQRWRKDGMQNVKVILARCLRLQNKNNKIKKENRILREENKFLKSHFEDIMVQLEYLKGIIFSKNKGNCSGTLKKAMLVPGTKRIKSIR